MYRRFTFILILLTDCGGGNTPPPAAPTSIANPDYYSHIAKILNENCVACHKDGGIAPFPLETYAQAMPFAGSIRDATAARIMPPFLMGSLTL